jgi:hypothetical protein
MEDEKKTKALPGIVINGQRVPWSFIQFVRNKKMGGDWNQTINAFWQARNAPNIIKYVQMGFKPDKNGRIYSLLPSKEMNDGKMEMIRQWWEGLYKPSAKNERGMMSLKQIFRELAK